MRYGFAVLLCSIAVWAQQNPSQQQERVAQLQGLADQVKSALAGGNTESAARLATELSFAIARYERALTLTEVEAGLPPDGPDRFHGLPRVAIAAFEASDYAKAEAYANELLTIASQHREGRTEKDRNYGDAIFYGNMVLGRIALHRDYNLPKAKAALLASSQTPGSPTLDSFGPNMSLAKDLLEVGEREAVVQFFEQCRSFWKPSGLQRRLDEWAGVVKGCCRLPDFGANLRYVP